MSTPSKTAQPAGLRPPAPPWARIIAWLVLIICLSLMAARTPLVQWADQQPRMSLPTRPTTSPPVRGAPVPQGLERVKANVALVIHALLGAPGLPIVRGISVFGLAGLGLELVASALVLVVQTSNARRQASTLLRVRVPQPATSRSATGESGADLLRALHRVLPAGEPLLGSAPRLTLLLSARPDEPIELAIQISGGTTSARQSWAAAIRKIIQGMIPDAVIDTRADPLAALWTTDRVATWMIWRLALSPSFPLRLHQDRDQADLFGPLIAALQPRQGVVYSEVQLILQARLTDVQLTQGWRAAALRRLLRLKRRGEHALASDAQALETKLHGPVYHTTLRMLTLAAPTDLASARAELREVDAVIGQYAARSGSRLQRWIRAGTGRAHRPAAASKRRIWIGYVLTLLVGSVPILGGVVAHVTLLDWIIRAAATVPRWPILTLPHGIARYIPESLAMLIPLFLSLILMALLQRMIGFTANQKVARLLARVPQAIPLPTIFGPAPWRGPAILGPEELCALWHLPTPSLGRLVRWLPCRYLPPPPHAFVQESLPPTLKRSSWLHRSTKTATPQPAADRLIIGYGRHRDDSEAPIGIPLRDARQGIAFTAPPGVGKTQLASNLADQLRPYGYTLIDGKGDDAGNLVETMRRRIPLEDEDRLVVLDVLDADWPIGLNPLAGVNLSDTGALDQVLGQIEAIFARLDPETWGKAPRMKNYLRKATLLVLSGEAHPTIAHVKQALLDEHYRQRLLPHCTNVEVRDFWMIEFPQIGEQQKSSRDALISRFDMLLDSELTRYLFNQTTPALSFTQAIAERLLILAPLPHRTLGGLAGPVGMLLFQSLMRAAFARPGTDLTRSEYGFIGDEFQVLVENCDTKDIRDALTQVRAFGIVTIIANQLHAQLGDLAEYALTAISNRILLRTQEPDATLYARHYAESGVTAVDISGQEPREHQYAWIGVEGRLTRLFSMRPLPWQPALELAVPAESDLAWQTQLPEQSPTPLFDQQIRELIYGQHTDPNLIAQALAAASDEHWAMLISRWDAIRTHQYATLLAHPGAIPETHERQRWLSRLRAARPRVLAQAEYARIRQAILPVAGTEDTASRNRPAVRAAQSSAGTDGLNAPVTQQPHYTQLNEREPQRLKRLEPRDQQYERDADPQDAVIEE